MNRACDAATGHPITAPIELAYQANAAALSPSGQWLTSDGFLEIRRGEWPAEERPVEHLIALAEFLSHHRIDETGAAVPLSADEHRKVWEKLGALALSATPQ